MRDDCERFHVAALLRPDGELTALELRLHEAHAGRCRDCGAYAAEIARITACIRRTPAERLERRVVVRAGAARITPVRAAAGLAIGLVIAAGLGETKESATAAPQVPAVAGTAGLRKAI